MKVKDLMEELKKLDPELEVKTFEFDTFKNEFRLLPVTDLTLGKTEFIEECNCLNFNTDCDQSEFDSVLIQ